VIARLRIPALLTAVALLAVACAEAEPPPVAFSGELAKGNPTTEEEVAEADATAPEPSELGDLQTADLQAAVESTPEGCEILVAESCLLPFPSDAYTVADPTSPTGRRVALPEGQLANVDGVPLDPTAWNENDGFSPSTPIVVHVPGLSADGTNLPSVTEIGMSVTEESATVLVDLDTGQLVPHWAELDARATADANRSLIIHPAASLIETHRVGVALRDLRRADGAPIPTPVQFQVLRDNYTSGVPALEERKEAYEVVFAELASAGINRKDLYLAWWFTVASADSLAGRVLQMRDDAFGKLKGSSPAFEITEVVEDGEKIEPGIARIVRGTFEVPLYLDQGGEPGSRMVFNDAGQPTADGTYTAPFVCTIPDVAVQSGEARPVVYGHGLLGSSDEASSSHVQATAADGNFVYCGTDAIGLSKGDTAHVAAVLSDLSLFPSVSDRLQQGILNYLYLGRLMLNMNGLGSSEPFQTSGGANLLNTEEAYYDGNSQGAIFGGAVTAVAQDWTKASLGVGGMDYSILLNRSVDFDKYFAIMRDAYPDPMEQQVLFAVIQMLWDRGETAGYVQHLTNRPYDLTPPKQVLMTVAFGDHQVANVTADNIARTLDIPLYQPVLPEGADDVPSAERFWDLAPIRKWPHTGSALFYWYSGTLPPPDGNITPIMGPLYEAECSGAAAKTDVACLDPHEDPRRQPQVMEMKDEFFQPDGTIKDVCREEPCLAEPRSTFDY
jgi:hypothetical protein